MSGGDLMVYRSRLINLLKQLEIPNYTKQDIVKILHTGSRSRLNAFLYNNSYLLYTRPNIANELVALLPIAYMKNNKKSEEDVENVCENLEELNTLVVKKMTDATTGWIERYDTDEDRLLISEMIIKLVTQTGELQNIISPPSNKNIPTKTDLYDHCAAIAPFAKYRKMKELYDNVQNLIGINENLRNKHRCRHIVSMLEQILDLGKDFDAITQPILANVHDDAGYQLFLPHGDFIDYVMGLHADFKAVTKPKYIATLNTVLGVANYDKLPDYFKNWFLYRLINEYAATVDKWNGTNLQTNALAELNKKITSAQIDNVVTATKVPQLEIWSTIDDNAKFRALLNTNANDLKDIVAQLGNFLNDSTIPSKGFNEFVFYVNMNVANVDVVAKINELYNPAGGGHDVNKTVAVTLVNHTFEGEFNNNLTCTDGAGNDKNAAETYPELVKLVDAGSAVTQVPIRNALLTAVGIIMLANNGIVIKVGVHNVHVNSFPFGAAFADDVTNILNAINIPIIRVIGSFAKAVKDAKGKVVTSPQLQSLIDTAKILLPKLTNKSIEELKTIGTIVADDVKALPIEPPRELLVAMAGGCGCQSKPQAGGEPEDDPYYAKYLKYKTKYLELKNK